MLGLYNVTETWSGVPDWWLDELGLDLDHLHDHLLGGAAGARRARRDPAPVPGGLADSQRDLIDLSDRRAGRVP